MRLRIAVALGLIVCAASSLLSHDLFLKLDDYFVPPDTTISIPVLNGTFGKSENAIARARVGDVSVVSTAGTTRLDTTAITAHGDTSRLTLRTGGPGTYVVGLSVRPSEITLTGAEFNQYLREEAVTNVLQARTRDRQLASPARERYAKHVKAVFQVGAARSAGFSTPLGYRVEIVPRENPYALRPGATLRVRCLLEGAPIAGQAVITGGRTRRGGRIAQRVLRTDAQGEVGVRLEAAGRWYVKFIHMEPATAPGADYESNWATLTFEVR
jgi:hypothetical protein